MTQLDQLAQRFGTDKNSRSHNYTRIYEQLFSNRESVRKFVEIGVFEGASVRMWEEWFPNATIYGVDPQQVFRFEPEPGSRIRILRRDQGVRDDLLEVVREVGPGVDAVIDDGSHMSDHQLLTFQFLWPCLRPGGVYVIEDLHCSYDPVFTHGLQTQVSEWIKGLVDVVNWHGRGGGDPTEEQVPSDTLSALEQQVESVQVWKSVAAITKKSPPRV